MESLSYKCINCKEVFAEDEIANHTCKDQDDENGFEEYIEDDVEYLETDSDMENEETKTGGDASELWAIHETKHLLMVYKEALPLLYGENGSAIDVWKTILVNMDSAVSAKFNADLVRDRINYIFSHKAKNLEKNKSLLPLIKEIEKLEKVMRPDNSKKKQLKNEEKSDDYDDDDDDDNIASTSQAENDDVKYGLDEDCDSIRWTGKETLQLISIYKEYIKELAAILPNKDKRKVWEKISSEMVMVGNRKCNPYIARMKIMNLKKSFSNQKQSNTASSWIYFKHMSEVMRAEEKAKEGLLGNKTVSTSSSEDEEIVIKRKRKSKEPLWFSQYKHDAEKRHGEKMNLKRKLLDLLERFADKLGE